MHVLIVDDSRAMRSILSHILRQLGCDVSEACNGREAWDRLQELVRVELALVDWNMPEVNGIEFVRKVRADARYSDLRLMMVTTETNAEEVAIALQAGADEYVMKPFSKQVMQEKLELLGLLCDRTSTTP